MEGAYPNLHPSQDTASRQHRAHPARARRCIGECILDVGWLSKKTGAEFNQEKELEFKMAMYCKNDLFKSGTPTLLPLLLTIYQARGVAREKNGECEVG